MLELSIGFALHVLCENVGRAGVHALRRANMLSWHPSASSLPLFSLPLLFALNAQLLLTLPLMAMAGCTLSRVGFS